MGHELTFICTAGMALSIFFFFFFSFLWNWQIKNVAEEIGEKVMPKTLAKIVAKKITFARVIGSVGRTGLLAVAVGDFIAVQTAPKYNVLREQKRRHPPLQLTPLGVQGHPGVRFVADLNTINLIEAIFEFPTQT